MFKAEATGKSDGPSLKLSDGAYFLAFDTLNVSCTEVPSMRTVKAS